MFVMVRKLISCMVIISLISGINSCSHLPFIDNNSNKHFPSPGEPAGNDALSSSTNMSGKEDDTSPKLDPLSGAVYLPPPQIGNYGSVSFSYPVSIPASRAFKPSVGLSYSSSGGDGLCGMGWTLSTGLGCIARTTSNGELYYDSRDTFTYNGKRLVKVSGSSSENGIYRCEIESEFMRFELADSSSGGVWRVYDTSGTVMILGETVDSRAYHPENINKTSVWNFTRSYDRNGNTMRAVYDAAAYKQNHILYLSEIRYGGTSSLLGSRLDDLQWVKFKYKSRDDAYVSKSCGFIMRMDRLLDEIIVGWDDPRAFLFTGTTLWNYNLVYEASEDSERPLLKTVTSSHHTTSPEFIYQKAQHTLAWQQINNIWSQDTELDAQKTRYFEGDFNGDGISDMLFFNPENGDWKAAEGTRAGGYTFKKYANGYKDYKTDDQIIFLKGNVTGDYNGDGRCDVAFYLPATRDFIVAEHNGLILNFKNYGRLPAYVSDIFACEWFCGDYDGNGLSDVLLFDEKSGIWTLMLNRGGSFEFKIVSKHLKNVFRNDYSPDANLDSASTMDDSLQGSHRDKVHFLTGDYSGDGRTDISVYDERTGDWVVGESSRNSVSGYAVEWIKYGTSTSLGDRGSMLFGNDRFSGDFNGDGFSDFLWYDRSNGNWWIGETGNRSINFRIFTVMPDAILSGTNISRWLQGDFNGDGKTDVGFYSADDGNFWIGESSRSGFRFRIYTNINYGGPDGDRVLAKAPLPKDEVRLMTLKSIIKNSAGSTLAEFPFDANTSESGGERVFAGSFSSEGAKELLVFNKRKHQWIIVPNGNEPVTLTGSADLSGNIRILNHEKPLKLSKDAASPSVDMIMYEKNDDTGNAYFQLLSVEGNGVSDSPIGSINKSEYDFDSSKSIYAVEHNEKSIVAVNDKPGNGEPTMLRIAQNHCASYEISANAGNEDLADEFRSLLKDARDTGRIKLFARSGKVFVCDSSAGTWYCGVFNTGEVKLYLSKYSGTAAWIADETQGVLCYDLWNDGAKDFLIYGTKKNGQLAFSEIQFNANGTLSLYNYFPTDYTWDGEFDHAHRAVIKNENGFAAASMNTGTLSIKSLSDTAVSECLFARSELYQNIYPFNWIQGDYNGDGKTDIGFFHLKENKWYYVLTRGTVSDMVSEIKNGFGGKYRFEYANSTGFDNTGGDGIPDLPVNYKVCTNMTAEDGMGHSISYSYDYKNGCAFSAFINGKKETDYFGFTDFIVRDVLGGKTVYSFNTMPYDDFRKNRALAGAVKTTSIYGTDGIEYSRTDNVYTLHEIIESASQTPSYLIEPTQVKKYVKGTLTETRASNIVLENSTYKLVSKSESITDHYSDSVYKETVTASESHFSHDEVTNEMRLLYKKNFAGSTHETQSDYEYDSRGNMTHETLRYTGFGLSKPKDRSTRYSYDDCGNCIKTINDSDSPERITESEYDSALHQYKVKDKAIGEIVLTTEFEINYDAAFGAIQKKTDPNGNSVYFDYDPYGRLARQRIDTEKGIETLAEYEYAPSVLTDGRLSVQTMTAKCIQYPGDGSKKETRVFADGFGRTMQSVWSATNESGKKYAKSGAIIYDVLGRVIKNGQPVWAADDDIDTYNAADLVNPTVTEYDPSGRVSKVTLPAAYDGEPETSTSYTYNDPWESTVMHSIGRSKRTVTNARGLVLYVEDSGSSSLPGDRISASMGFLYDLAGNKIKKMDLNGTTMTSTVDSSLFAFGKKDASGNAAAQWRYDGFGQLIETSDPDLGYSRAEYDGFGQVIKRVDAQTRETMFAYDRIGRLISKILPGNEGVVQYHYDLIERPLHGFLSNNLINARGKLTEIEDPYQTKILGYDKIGRVKHEERKIAGDSNVFVSDFSYDLLNRTKSIQYPEDPVSGIRIKVKYEYCPSGVTSISLDRSLMNKDIVNNIRYNVFGQIEHIERGNATRTDYTYDVRGRLKNLVTKKGGDVIQDTSYSFLTDNSIASKEDSTGEKESARKVRYEYNYDVLNRLTDAKGSFSQGTDETRAKKFHYGYSYAQNGNIVGKTEFDTSTNTVLDKWTYSYISTSLDASISSISNASISTMSIAGVSLVSDAGNSSESFAGNFSAFDASRSSAPSSGISSVSATSTGHAVQNIYSSRNGRLFRMKYDASGNMVRDSGVLNKTKEYEFDSSNRIRTAREAESGKKIGEYSYDDQGFRIRKMSAEIISGSESQVEVLYPSMYFAIEKQRQGDGQEIPNTAYACNNIYLNGVRIAASLPDGTCRYYHGDQVDSVNAVSDDSGKVITRTEYEPFGNSWIQEGDADNRPKYQGQEYDAETGLYYMNARYQNPTLCRFQTPDTVVDGEYDTQGWNRYSYCRNNPVRYKDPSGHEILASIFGSLILRKDDGNRQKNEALLKHEKEQQLLEEQILIYNNDNKAKSQRISSSQRTVSIVQYLGSLRVKTLPDGTEVPDTPASVKIVEGSFENNPEQWVKMKDYSSKKHYKGSDEKWRVDLGSAHNPEQTWWGPNAKFRVDEAIIGESGYGSRISMSILSEVGEVKGKLNMAHFTEINKEIYEGRGRIFDAGTYIGRTKKIIGFNTAPHLHMEMLERSKTREYMQNLTRGK